MINDLSSEVTNLKRESKKKQVELIKNNRYINSISSEIVNIYKNVVSTKIDPRLINNVIEMSLISNLKKQISEMELELRKKKEELEKIKKNMKFTKIAELTEENLIFKEELRKLSRFNENSMRKVKEYQFN